MKVRRMFRAKGKWFVRDLIVAAFTLVVFVSTFIGSLIAIWMRSTELATIYLVVQVIVVVVAVTYFLFRLRQRKS